MPQNIRKWSDVSVAARSRVAVLDGIRPEGPLLPTLREDLAEACRNTDFHDRYVRFRDWVELAPSAVLDRAVAAMRSKGIDPARVYQDLRARTEDEAPEEAEGRRQRARRGLQRRLMTLWRAKTGPEMHFRIRHKLARWDIEGRPRQVAEKFSKHILHCRSCTPPRVRAALWNTAWNRWPTACRFQLRGTASSRCVFGCSPTAEDSIEHYSYCKVIREAHWRHLAIAPNMHGSLLPAWLLAEGAATKEVASRMALGVYATYRSFCTQRHSQTARREDLVDMFGQYVREGAMNHPGAEAALNKIWTRAAPETGREEQQTSRRRRLGVAAPLGR